MLMTISIQCTEHVCMMVNSCVVFFNVSHCITRTSYNIFRSVINSLQPRHLVPRANINTGVREFLQLHGCLAITQIILING